MSVSEAANTSNPNAKQGDPTQEEKLAVVCILSVLSVFGTCGNGLVLYVFSSKGNKVTSTIFILALAGTDFITCLLIIPLTVVNVAADSYFYFDFVCKLYQFLITCNVPLAAFIMVAIAVDRYFSICHPFLHAVTPCRARVTVFLLCVFAFVLGTITAMGHSTYNYVNVTGEEINVAGAPPSSVELSSGATLELSGNESTPETLREWTDADNVSENVRLELVFTGTCNVVFVLLTSEFLHSYQKVFASFYLLSLIAVCIIYALIYRSVVQRREWRRRQRSGKPSRSAPTLTTEVEDIELRSKNGTENGGVNETQSLNSSEKKANKERRDFNFLANIRTAAMLFVVTLVFIIAFLPSWLMAVQLVDYKVIVFYCYFVYNVANPVIYAFMNHAFRKELKRVFQRGTNCFVCKPRLYS